MNLENLVKDLKSRGFRLTRGRKDLLRIIHESDTPVSAAEILSKTTNIDRSTVYRELSFLKKNNIISETTLSDMKARYELAGEHCHHHLVCEQCGHVDHISISETKLLKAVSSKYHFKIKSHTIEFFGLCTSCQ